MVPWPWLFIQRLDTSESKAGFIGLISTGVWREILSYIR